jgi:hypothetical protein
VVQQAGLSDAAIVPVENVQRRGGYRVSGTHETERRRSSTPASPGELAQRRRRLIDALLGEGFCRPM